MSDDRHVVDSLHFSAVTVPLANHHGNIPDLTFEKPSGRAGIIDRRTQHDPVAFDHLSEANKYNGIVAFH